MYLMQMAIQFRPEIIDQTFKKGALLRALERKGVMKSIDDPTDLQTSLKTEDITGQMYAARGQITIDVKDPYTDAAWELAYGAFTGISYMKDTIFTGKSRLFKVWERYKKDLIADSAKQFEEQILNGGGTLDVEGITYVLDGSHSSGTFGGIDRSLLDLWRPQYIDFSSKAWITDGIQQMDLMFDKCSDDGIDPPDLIVMTEKQGRAYAQTGTAKAETELAAKALNLGYQALFFRGAEIVKTSRLAAGIMLFLNTKDLSVVHPATNWMKFHDGFKVPTRPGDIIHIWTFALQVIWEKMRSHGRIDGISIDE